MLISNAYAQAAGAAADPTGGFMSMIPLILMFAVLWFVMIRPQMKKQKETQKMITELKKGDDVTTTGGIAGRITKVDDTFLTIKIAANVEVQIQRQAVASLLPPDSLKGL